MACLIQDQWRRGGRAEEDLWRNAMVKGRHRDTFMRRSRSFFWGGWGVGEWGVVRAQSSFFDIYIYTFFLGGAI